MGSISLTQKCVRQASTGAWNWGSLSGVDYVDNNSYNYYCAVYKASVSYSSGEYLQSITAGVRIYAGGSTFSLQGATVRATLYTSDPTGGSSLPSGISTQTAATDMTSSGQVYSFTFSGLALSSSTVYVGFTVDKPSQYGNTAHAIADASTASISGSWYTPPTPTYCTLITQGDQGISSTSGGGTLQVPGVFHISCTVAQGYQFDGWYYQGTKYSSNTSMYVRLTGAITVTMEARTTVADYSVTITPWDYIDSVSGEGSYNDGETVSVYATVQSPTATEEYVFDRWVDINTSQVVSRDNPYSFVIHNDVWLEAYGRAQAIGSVRINNGTEFIKATPYIFNGSSWQRAIPNAYDGDEWKQTS